MEGKIQAEDEQLKIEELLLNLGNFFDDIEKKAKNYRYVSIAERRCFNLAYDTLSSMENLVTYNGLLLQYRKLVQYYLDNNRTLPRLLLVDDILLHGRGLSKFLYSLEMLLRRELEDRNEMQGFSDYYRLHQSLNDAIDIEIYGLNQSAIVLDELYVKKIKSWKTLYSGELRNLSIQLSKRLQTLDVANTAFICSVRNRQMASYLADTETLPNTQWRIISQQMEEDKAKICIRLYGDDSFQRISTIRIFPNRYKESCPQVTSFSLLGSLPNETLIKICEALVPCLTELECTNLAKIMQEEKEELRPSQGQIIYYLISMADFWRFCNEALPEEVSCEVKKDTLADIPKIAINLGGIKQYKPELLNVTREKNSLKIMKVIEESLKNAKLGAIWPEEITLPFLDSKLTEPEDFASDTFFQIGVDAEKKALLTSKKRVIFLPFQYQEGLTNKADPWNDGMIPIYSLLCYGKCNTTIDIFQYIASVIYLMDVGVLSIKSRWIKDTAPKNLVLMACAGELSLAFFPKKLAALIPAFAQAEMRSFLVGEKFADLIYNLYFAKIHPILTQPDRRKHYFPNLSSQDECTLDKYIFDREWLESRLKMLYASGQSFRGWNYTDIVAQKETCLVELQNLAVKIVNREE